MAVAFDLIFTFEDDSGDTSTTTVNIPTSFSLAQYIEFGRALAQLIDPLTGAKITSAEMGVTADISAVTSNTADTGSDVQDVGRFTFTTGQNRKVSLSVAGISSTVLADGTNNIDVADANVVALVNAMTNGLATAGGTIQPTDIGEDDVVSLVSGLRKTRGRGVRA